MKDTSLIITTQGNRDMLLNRAITSAKLNNFEEIIIIGPRSVSEVANYFEVEHIICDGTTAHKYNKGLAKAGCEYTMFLNDDDFYLTIPNVFGEPNTFTYTDCYVERDGVIIKRICKPKILEKGNYIHYLTVRAKTDLLRNEKFDESVMYLEDYEMWLRLKSKGVPMRYIPVCFAVYNDCEATDRKSKSTELLKELKEVRRKYCNDKQKEV